MAEHLVPEQRWLSSRSTLQILSDDATEGSGTGFERSSDRLFACPYLKRNPCEYMERQSCSRSGWTTIHGLRQHVYRCHILPIKCQTCSQTFNSSRMFTQHLLEQPDCDRSLCEAGEADEPITGLESLLQKVKAPKLTAENSTEEDMWYAIYANLFPNDPKDFKPYPYYEKYQGTPMAGSIYESDISIHRESLAPSIPSIESPCPCNYSRTHTASNSVAPSLSGRTSTRPTSTEDAYGQILRGTEEAHGTHAHPARPGFSRSTTYTYRTSGLANGVTVADSPDAEISDPLQAPEPVYSSDRRKLKKKLRRMTLDTQVLKFRAWEKPHRTDEHINPGVYRGFWKWLARCFTFYIPSWFLKRFLGMNDLRQRLAFRQKVLFCFLLFAVYTVLCYFLIIQPVVSCVVKAHIGMFSNNSRFCGTVRDLIYVYMGLGGAFMLVVAVCVVLVRYKSRKFVEHDALVVMQIPVYNEDEATLRKTIESCVQSTYEKKRKLLFLVADGTVAAAGQKATYKILLEDIFNHSADLEAGLENQAHSYMSYDGDGESNNRAISCTGHYRGVPYVLVVKIGREDEQDSAKPGNRGKRDSQLLTYNFFHYVNYRRFWNPFFENLEFKMRTSLSMDARDAMYMLAIDCDTAVDETGISYLVHQLEKNPKLLGVCGYTGVGNAMSSFVASSQVFEYWLTHAVLKAVESICCDVLVLSGCFTIYRLKWQNNRPAILHPLLLEDYAGTYEKTLHEHNLLSIGEDRYLSTLAIRYFGSDCRLRYFSAATCTTAVPTTLSVLMDQRRRWTNSLIHCHFAHLNVLPFEASFWTYCRLLFIIGAELFMVFVLPLALPAGLALAIISVLLTPYAWAILLAFTLLPVLLCTLCADWTYIPFYLPFFPMVPMFSVVIPIFSIWNQDNIKWGKTRGG